MKKLLLFLTFSIAVGCSGGSDEATDNLPEITQTPYPEALFTQASALTLEKVNQFNTQATALNTAIRQLCEDNTEEKLSAAQTAWQNTNHAWAQAQVIQFGPIEENNLNLRINFWPDKNNLAASQLNTLLAQDTAITAESIAAGSAATQGLPAMKHLLYTLEQNERNCAALQAISDQFITLIAPLHTGWQADYGQAFAEPHKTNAYFTGQQAALDAYINSFITILEALKLQDSHLSTTQQLEAIETFYLGDDDFGLDDYLASLGLTSLSFQIENQLELALTEAAQETPETTELTALLKLIKNDLAQTLDVFVSFNANDGD